MLFCLAFGLVSLIALLFHPTIESCSKAYSRGGIVRLVPDVDQFPVVGL